jgi:hypothetical protein
MLKEVKKTAKHVATTITAKHRFTVFPAIKMVLHSLTLIDRKVGATFKMQWGERKAGESPATAWAFESPPPHELPYAAFL